MAAISSQDLKKKRINKRMRDRGEDGEWEGLVLLQITGGDLIPLTNLFFSHFILLPFACPFPFHVNAWEKWEIPPRPTCLLLFCCFLKAGPKRGLELRHCPNIMKMESSLGSALTVLSNFHQLLLVDLTCFSGKQKRKMFGSGFFALFNLTFSIPLPSWFSDAKNH